MEYFLSTFTYLYNLTISDIICVFQISFFSKMVGKQNKISTRSGDTNKFAGPPSMLDKTEPPTYRQVIQHSYFLENIHPTSSKFALSKLIAGDIIDIWKAVNPRLPLLTELYIVNKLQNICFKKVKQINRKSLSSIAKNSMIRKLDTLFDISSCCCQLPILSCEDKNVKCKKENCQTKHIICNCPLKQKVSLLFYFSFFKIISYTF